MSGVTKYSNIENELPKLPEVLLNTIQSDVLEIKSVDKNCKKYIDACSKIPELKDAHYVVFSKYIDKNNHKYEKFIFLAEDGEELFDVSGTEMELYGLLSCTTLNYTEEYEASVSKKD
ncbi:MAG: hypothetical protein WC279_01565 [Sulfurimonas sp.]|jgi:hypothetical protein|uniref:hypothetical protein n=1 Tax=unclassified Sulfurimonas TaxID=2623549 RepID=UPI0008B2BFC5|nr:MULTISPECIES: hypothetical protein [unclassified Sulfurimonas]OHE07029.1 MAG: hypothetical protein A2329_02840 [Sulfurimonas sp. RIFOXYB2_FULL_37_5]OHE08197.1 MAG: hypothetical protein A3J96_06830 [Sulfurimonas sp. RIFOXYC2_FULL_36_7]OHE21296.1 MAG: hypothetical protein A2525_03120 [Sulfurimonas sp. RIFOXYD12_FULL_36_11]MBS4069392.1 hypothetical protein [Sulfurimonas sp.]MDD3855793.1 hypothetical protein [Sulfurimonas sp.]